MSRYDEPETLAATVAPEHAEVYLDALLKMAAPDQVVRGLQFEDDPLLSVLIRPGLTPVQQLLWSATRKRLEDGLKRPPVKDA